MANIFLSYARDDLATAKRVAAALESTGHSVWWDRHLSAGSRFSKEIDTALRAADLVLVLWSRTSIESAWVQDEAAFGRDHGRLLPVLIDAVEPPLGFRQFQAISIARSARKLDALLAAIATRLGEPVSVPMSRPRPLMNLAVLWRPSDRTTWWRWDRWDTIGTILLVLIASWMLFFRGASEPTYVVGVEAAAGGDQSRSQELARSVVADLGRYKAGPLGALTILGSGRGRGDLDYRVEVGVSEAGGGRVRADVSLLSPRDSRILWTTTEQVPADRFVDLRQRAAAMLGDVLSCAVAATSRGFELKPDVLSLYLNGCGRMSDLIFDTPDQEALSIFRQITERAPDFGPAWASLAFLEAQSFPGTPPSDRPALRKALVAHLAKAKELDPTLPETVAADAFFHPNDGTKAAHALRVLERGLERYPDSATLHTIRSLFLRDVGRMNDGITAGQRAIGLNPLSPTIRDTYISALAYAGRTAAAYDALKEADAIWPGSTVLGQARYRLDLRYGDPKEALRFLEQRGSGDLRPVPMDTAWQSFLEARISPSQANIEKALDAFRARYRRSQGDVPGYLQALGHFERVDEAYEAVNHELALDSLMAGTEVLFRPHMRTIRSDPRFIALAAKLGLLAYWEKTDYWPDFCREPQLPYDCRQEAAKLTPEQRKLAKFIRV